MPKLGERLTISQVRHELDEASALLCSLRRGLDFLTAERERKILYLVDYPEIDAYWASRKPGTAKHLSQDGRVEKVWHYLTGLEQVFLILDDEDANRLQYVQRAYEEQAEYLDALLLNSAFSTMIAPPCWRLLEDAITYFSHYDADPGDSWNAAINENELLLRQLIPSRTSSNYSEQTYISEAERFGFASLARKRSPNRRDIVLPFINHANFCDPTDFPWTENPEPIKVEIRDFEPSERAAYWLGWIDRGNQLYNEAYGHHGQWARRDEGAETLAYLEFLNTIARRNDPSVIVAFVTRNRQYYQALSAMRNEAENDQSPLIFHPRILGAFMIKQGAGMGASERQRHAKQAKETVIELSEHIASIEEIISGFSIDSDTVVSTALANFIRQRLKYSWTSYRRQSLAEQIKLRIELRQSRWRERKKNDRIRKYLEEIVQHKLMTIQISRELALLKGLPNVKQLSTEIDCTFMPLTGEEGAGAVLFHSELLTHPFRFHSSSIRKRLSDVEKGHEFDVVDLVQTARSECEDKYRDYLSKEQKPKLSNEIEVQTLRFDVLLMFAILLTMKGRFGAALRLIGSARVVWQFVDARKNRKAREQLAEALYLEGLVQRLEWRLGRSDRNTKDHLAIGSSALTNLISEADELKNLGVARESRFQVFLVAFTRELYSVAALEKSTQAKVGLPYQVDECLEQLDLVFENAKKAGFVYIAMRARQQYLAFARMFDDGELKSFNFDRSRFAREVRVAVFEEFLSCLNQLRSRRMVAEESLPFSVLVTEVLGLWGFREEIEIDNDMIESRVQNIDPLLKKTRGRNYTDWASRKISDIRKKLRKG